MLKQGGNLKVGGNRYEIKRKETNTRNSKGDYESPFKQQFLDDYE